MLLMLSVAMHSYAQGGASIEVSDLSVKQEQGLLLINMIVKSEFLKVHTAQSLWLDITLENEERVLQLPALVYTGKQRYRFDERNKKLSSDELSTTPHQVFKGINEETIYLSDYVCEIPYSNWMDNASLRLKCMYHDCCDEWLVAEEVLIAHTRSVWYAPETEDVITREIEQQRKLRKEIVERTFTSSIRYAFKSDELLFDFENNQHIFATIDSLLINEGLTVRAVRLKGYSSPEGTYHTNRKLAKTRAAGLEKFLCGKYRLDNMLFDLKWVAEDWDGVLEALKYTEITHKAKVIDIINHVGIFKGREAQLMDLAGGRPYLQIMDQIFPALRRVELEIDYEQAEYK